MNILFVFFTMSHLSQSSMYSDMVNVFRENGHQVFPIAPINEVGKKTSFISKENEIEVLRVKTLDVFSKNKFKKGFANLLLSHQFKNSYNKFWKDKKIDLIVVATPSVMFADFVAFLKKKHKAKTLLMQKDIFPQNAVDLGYMKKNGITYNFFKKHELKLLKTADFIGCTSPGNIEYLLQNNDFLIKENMRLLYNSTKLLEFSQDDNIKIKYNLQDKYVVVFGGNMGKPQQLENVLLLAKKCEIFIDVVFLIIGSGTEVDALKVDASQQGLKNINFVEKVPRKEYFQLLSNCNVGLISLHKNFTVPNTPMKLNDYLNAGIPVLASIDRSNDLGFLLEKNQMGEFAYADTPEDLFDAFKKLYQDKERRKKLGQNGKEFCKENLSAYKSYQTIIKLVENV
ncbi:hypothetical protein B0A70_14480 [Chryseobacterium piscicola]|uniref:Glycosyl transferase family 1 domain-containing protein n=2 Tax=Chryseobacterium piscicola TaxID=551459 RepID=A0A2S7KCC0_9FLAO|nr:hypothetical protein B0A70_14480 [Chryseobacterium piscicola]